MKNKLTRSIRTTISLIRSKKEVPVIKAKELLIHVIDNDKGYSYNPSHNPLYVINDLRKDDGEKQYHLCLKNMPYYFNKASKPFEENTFFFKHILHIHRNYPYSWTKFKSQQILKH